MDKSSSVRESRVERFKEVDIYPVTCEPLSNGKSDIEVLKLVIEGGAKIIQLRDKISTKNELQNKAKLFREITLEHEVLLIINDHADIAMAVNADGIHLGQEDLEIKSAREMLPNGIIGVSTHSIEEAQNAYKSGADYINIGPLFATKTKDNVCPPVGLGMVKEILGKVSLPHTVMGGINESNMAEVLKTGSKRIAMVSEITKSSNIPQKVKALRELILSHSL